MSNKDIDEQLKDNINSLTQVIENERLLDIDIRAIQDDVITEAGYCFTLNNNKLSINY